MSGGCHERPVGRFLLRTVVTLAALSAACWGAGFIWFMQSTRRAAEPPPHTDGIVALTGGAGRVELALHLLSIGQADKLLVSGIGGRTDLVALGHLAGIDTAPLGERITLGRDAASTRGNGMETAVWAEQNRITSLIVVTAAYHMPRALAELHQALPRVQIFPLPVRPTAGMIERGPGWRLEAEEYTKYLLAVSGLSALLPHREAISGLRMPGGAPGGAEG
jgi:uncharacterized SAM-binding protein YcdF (DUF218 family)